MEVVEETGAVVVRELLPLDELVVVVAELTAQDVVLTAKDSLVVFVTGLPTHLPNMVIMQLVVVFTLVV